MNGKSLLIVCALALSIIGIASAKSYAFTLGTPATAGATELKAGDYNVSVNGTQAVIKGENGKSVTVNVSIEHAAKKFEDTTVESGTKDGKAVIQAIDLGGSDMRLVLGS